MKLSDSLKSKSLWLYIVSFSVLFLFVFLLMGTYLYMFFYRTMEKDFEQSNKDYLFSITTQHENNMQVLTDIMSQMSLAENKVEFYLDEQPQKSFDLKDSLKQYVSVSPFFKDIYFFYHPNTYLYNPSTSMSLAMFLDKGLVLENTTPKQLKEVILGEEPGFYILPEQAAKGLLLDRSKELFDSVLVFILPMEPKRNSSIIFIVGNRYYDELFKTVTEDNRSTYLFYEDRLILKRGPADFVPDMTVFSKYETPDTIIQEEITHENKNYLASWHEGESGIKYCTIQSYDLFENKILANQGRIFLVLALSSIPTSIVFWLLAKSLSDRVKDIGTLLGAEESYDLEQLRLGVRNLIEDREESSEQKLLYYRTQFIRKLIAVDYTSREEMLRAAAQVDLEINKPFFLIAITACYESKKQSTCNELLLDAIRSQIGIDGYGIHLINNNQSLFVLFGDDKSLLRKTLEYLFSVGNNYCEHFIMSAGNIHDNVMNADKAYLEADAAFNSRLMHDNSQIIYFNEAVMQEPQFIISENYLRRLRNSIRRRSIKENEKVIGEICEKLRSSGQSLLTFRLLSNDIIRMLMSEWPEQINNYNNACNVFALTQCHTIDDFKNILTEVSQRLMQTPLKHEDKDEGLINEAIDLMKEHYTDPDFTIGALADALEISGASLAVTFKESTDLSPSDYLTMLKMEKAKELLLEKDYLVKEAADFVGYSDSRVFIRRFKAYTAMTPGQYKKRYKKRDENEED